MTIQKEGIKVHPETSPAFDSGQTVLTLAHIREQIDYFNKSLKPSLLTNEIDIALRNLNASFSELNKLMESYTIIDKEMKPLPDGHHVTSSATLEAPSIHTNDKTVGVLQPASDLVIFDPDDVLGRIWFGKSFSSNSRSTIITMMIFVIPYMIGGGLPMLAAWNFISREYMWCGFLTYPLVFMVWSCVNKKIFWVTCQQQNFVLITLFNLSYLINMLLMRHPSECYGLFIHARITIFLSCQTAAFIDAFPLWMRKIVGYILYPPCLGLLCGEWLAMYFNWFQFTDVVYNVTGHIRYQASTYAASALINLQLLLLQGTWNVFMRPDHLIMTKARMQIAIVDEIEEATSRSYIGKPFNEFLASSTKSKSVMDPVDDKILALGK